LPVGGTIRQSPVKRLSSQRSHNARSAGKILEFPVNILYKHQCLPPPPELFPLAPLLSPFPPELLPLPSEWLPPRPEEAWFPGLDFLCPLLTLAPFGRLSGNNNTFGGLF
jgi:hypothetical protein